MERGRAPSDPEVAPLYRLRLGKPLGGETEENGVYWRAFEAGLVAVNPDRKKDSFIAVKPPIPDHPLSRLSSATAPSTGPATARRIPPTRPKNTADRGVRCHNADASGESGLIQSVN